MTGPRLTAASLAALILAGCGSSTPPAGDGAAAEKPALVEASAEPTEGTPAPAATPSGTRRPASPSAAPVWSSGPVTVNRRPAPTPRLVAVRTGHHPTYDRVVFEFAGSLPGYRIRYVPRITADGSGAPVPLTGQAFLAVAFDPAVAHDASGRPTSPRRLTPGYPALKELAFAGDFEAVVSYGLGLDDVVGYRVLTMTNPTRLVIDVAG